MSLLDYQSNPNIISRDLTKNVTMHIGKCPPEHQVKDDKKRVQLYLTFWCFDTVCIFPKINLFEINENGEHVLVENNNNNHKYILEINKLYVFKIGNHETKHLKIACQW